MDLLMLWGVGGNKSGNWNAEENKDVMQPLSGLGELD
jgi:hypothetical protein